MGYYSAIHQLPEYMKVAYRALLDVYSEIDVKLGEERSYHVRYAREVVSIDHTNKFLILFVGDLYKLPLFEEPWVIYVTQRHYIS